MKLELPVVQNWNCHSCGGCCTQHEVEITEEERQRILSQEWTPEDGLPEGVPKVVRKGPPWRKRWVLGWQDSGACVFLDEQGLCRMHAKFGEASKPLACRVYPYAFHPAGKKVVVSVRFSCPSAVGNRGRAVRDQRRAVERLAQEAVPDFVHRIPPPEVSRGSRVEWPDFLRFVKHLEEELAAEEGRTWQRLSRALTWLNLVEQARFDDVQGKRLEEFLELIRGVADDEVPDSPEELEPPSKPGRQQFRMHVANYARRDTQGANAGGLANRWRLFTAAIRFARGKGDVPPLQSVFARVPFATVEEPFGPLPDEAEEMLTRYLRVKVSGLQFCGRAFFGASLVEGFRSLALVYPSVLWMSRWLAAGEGRTRLEADDVARAIAFADHFHAYSPVSGQWTSKRRVRLLSQLDDVRKLVAWYSR